MSVLLRYLRSLPPALWLYWGLLLASLYGFALLAEEVIKRERIAFDRATLTLLERHQSDWLDAATTLLNVVGGSTFLIPVTIAVSTLLWHRHRRSGVFFALAALGAMGLNLVAKVAFERARPDLFEALVPAGGYAFPSGHTMSSTAVALAAFFVIRFHALRWQGLALALGALFALAVGVSRCYLQVHYPSDVLAGWVLASAWVMGVNAWYARTRS